MAKYFFHVRNGTVHNDIVGDELPNAAAAWQEATVIAGQLLRDLDGNLRPGQEISIEVTDEAATPLYSIRVETISHQ